MSTSGIASFMRCKVTDIFADLLASASLIKKQRTLIWLIASIITKKKGHFALNNIYCTQMAACAEPVTAEFNGRSQSPSHQSEEKDDLPVQSKPTSQYGEDVNATMSVVNKREKKRVW